MQPGPSGDLFRTAFAHFQAGRLGEAEQACRQALQADPHHVASLLLLGLIADRAGHSQAALALFDQTLALSPDFAQAHCSRGMTLGGLGRLEEAEQAFRRSLALKPGQAEAWFGLGNVKAAQNSPDAAI